MDRTFIVSFLHIFTHQEVDSHAQQALIMWGGGSTWNGVCWVLCVYNNLGSLKMEVEYWKVTSLLVLVLTTYSSTPGEGRAGSVWRS